MTNQEELESAPTTAESTESCGELIDSSSLLGAPSDLRARAEEDGYLFFRGLLPREQVLELRRQVLEVLGRHGWLHAQQSDTGGRIDVDAINTIPAEELRVDIGISRAAYFDMQCLELMHRLPHHRNLISLYEALAGGDIFVHPRHIMRIMTPHRSLSPTPPHQDFPLVQGTTKTWTCWFPIGDCPRDLGTLAVLRGSHRAGYIPIQPSVGAGAIAAQLCDTETDWLTHDFQAGDILTFPSLTVHRALKSERADEVRMSLDVRYQSVDEPIEQRSLGNHSERSWNDVYRSWGSDELMYYWERHAMTQVPWDDTLLQPGRRIC